eukprot:SAG11_NODE_4902_length_1729_cov_2.017791_3_plen_37_part_00
MRQQMLGYLQSSVDEMAQLLRVRPRSAPLRLARDEG